MFRTSACLWFVLAAVPAYADQNVVVVLDDSASMNQSMRNNRRLAKMQTAKDALLTVLESLPAETRIGIVLLNGGWGSDRWVYPLAPVDTARLRAGIQRIRAHGGTPLGARIKDGCDTLLALRGKEHYGSYRLLIVTDGEASDGDLVERYLPDILSRGIWVDVIGVDMASDHSLATQVHAYRQADNPRDLIGAIREFTAEFSDDDPDANQADVELLAAFPAEVATAALEALAQPRNHPIGEQPPPEPDLPPEVLDAPDQAQSLDPVPVAPSQPPSGRSGSSGGSVAFGSVCAGLSCVAIFGVLVGILYMVASSSRRRR